MVVVWCGAGVTNSGRRPGTDTGTGTDDDGDNSDDNSPSKNTKPGHGMFDQEQPEEIQLQRAEQRRQAAEARSLKEWQKIKEEQ